MSVPNQGQSRAHPAQRGPPLNVQAPNIVELTESLSAGNFEKIGIKPPRTQSGSSANAVIEQG